MAKKGNKKERIAIVHDFMFQFGGAEKVLERLFKLFPEADFYTSFCIPEKFVESKELSAVMNSDRLKTTLIQKLFNIKNKKGNRLFTKFQKHFFFLYPILMRGMVVKDYDFVFITSTDCAKHITLKNNKKITHYCHTPTRYLHNLTPEINKKSLHIIYRIFIPFFVAFLKPLDFNAVDRLNKAGAVWYGNSEFIQRTIWEIYKTQSKVLYPPIELNNFLKVKRKPNKGGDEFYLSFGRVSFHKRIDVAIKACLKLKKKLIVGGTSPLESDLDGLKKIVSDYKKESGDDTDYIKFVGRISDQDYWNYQSKAKAFLFPGKEDFGITPVECLAAGLPVIAFAKGGALEYVKHEINGILYKDQSVEGMIGAILDFEKIKLEPKQIKDSVLKFDPLRFDKRVESMM